MNTTMRAYFLTLAFFAPYFCSFIYPKEHPRQNHKQKPDTVNTEQNNTTCDNQELSSMLSVLEKVVRRSSKNVGKSTDIIKEYSSRMSGLGKQWIAHLQTLDKKEQELFCAFTDALKKSRKETKNCRQELAQSKNELCQVKSDLCKWQADAHKCQQELDRLKHGTNCDAVMKKIVTISKKSRHLKKKGKKLAQAICLLTQLDIMQANGTIDTLLAQLNSNFDQHLAEIISGSLSCNDDDDDDDHESDCC